MQIAQNSVDDLEQKAKLNNAIKSMGLIQNIFSKHPARLEHQKKRFHYVKSLVLSDVSSLDLESDVGNKRSLSGGPSSAKKAKK